MRSTNESWNPTVPMTPDGALVKVLREAPFWPDSPVRSSGEMRLTGHEGVSILSDMVHALGKTNMKNKSKRTCMLELSFQSPVWGSERRWGPQLRFLRGKGVCDNLRD